MPAGGERSGLLGGKYNPKNKAGVEGRRGVLKCKMTLLSDDYNQNVGNCHKMDRRKLCKLDEDR